MVPATGEASNYAIAMNSPQVIADFQKDWVKRYKDKFGIEPGIAASGAPRYCAWRSRS